MVCSPLAAADIHHPAVQRSGILAVLCNFFSLTRKKGTTASGASAGGFGSTSAGAGSKRRTQRKPGKANHRREQCPLGRDPDLEAIRARQSLGLPLTGRLTEQQVKRAHKLLAVSHHPDKGGEPGMMTRFNNARDTLLEPEMEAISG